MVDLAITPANVVAGNTAVTEDGTCGETIAAGKAVYKSTTGTSAGRWMLADSNSATVEARQAIGIALSGGALNQPLTVLKSGRITIGPTTPVMVPGVAYYLSDTPGGICPVADVGSGEFVCQFCLAESATSLVVDIQFPNVSN